jgi:desulfoferrodoxin-like iron-binding protein
MTKKSEVYKCENCGAIVAIIKGGDGTLDCCSKTMVEVTPSDAKKLVHGLSRPGAP